MSLAKMKCITVLFVVILVSLSQSAKLPSTFQICKRSDPNINECFKSAIQNALPQLKNGIPELKFRPIEPVEVDSMIINPGSNAVNLVQKFKNVKIHELSNSIIESTDVKLNDNEFTAVVHMTVPNIKVESDYDFDGKILVLPIKGKGGCIVSFKSIVGVITMKGQVIDKNGQHHLKVNDVGVDVTPYDGNFHLDNLFDGDENLGNEMNKMINENWQDLFQEVKPAYVEMLSTLVKDTANSIFSKVPFDDIFPK